MMDAKRKSAQGTKKAGFWLRYLRTLRFYLVTGLLVWIPLIVTVWLTWWLFKKVGLGLEDLIKSGYGAVNSLGERYEFFTVLQTFEYRPGFGFLIAVALFLTTGFVARNLVGRRVISYGEQLLNRIPLISRIYRAVRQIRDVFVRRDGAVFQEVCLVEYPRKNIYAVAFITSREQGVVQESVGKEMISVFLPTTPNPTSGFLLYLSADEVTLLDITIEEAMKLVISGGAYMPGLESPDDTEAARDPSPAATPDTG